MSHQRRLTFDLDLEQVRPIVRDLDPSLQPTGVSRLAGGSTEVYRIDVAAGAPPLVLKLYADEPVWNPAKETLVAGWIGKAAPIPIPRWLKVDETRTRLPLRFALITWLPGQTVRSFKGEPGVASAYRQMGAALRRLHEIPMDGFGYVLGGGIETPHPTNAAYMAHAFERLFRRFRDQSGDNALTRELEQAAGARFDLLTLCQRPALLHQDFQPGNLLAERGDDGALRLTGLIDFANARAGDPLMDLATALSCCAHEDPTSRAPLLEGYGPVDHPDLDGALWLYVFFFRLSLWTWLMEIGDPGAAGPAGALGDLVGGGL
jgi:aminoglycoside phosphotransferase (APT) family kinase protein